MCVSLSLYAYLGFNLPYAGSSSTTEHWVISSTLAASPLSNRVELRVWSFLISILGIRDSWYSSMAVEANSLRFSRFGWKESEGCHSRLDHIYVSSGIEGWSNYTSILTGFTCSDHSPVSLTLDPIYKKKSECNLRIPVKKVRKSVIVMQRRFCVYVCARITRQRVRERALKQSYVYCLLHILNSYKELV